jgi:hypothetical protein
MAMRSFPPPSHLSAIDRLYDRTYRAAGRMRKKTFTMTTMMVTPAFRVSEVQVTQVD